MKEKTELFGRILLSIGVSLGILTLMFKLVAGGQQAADTATLAEVLGKTALRLVGLYILFQVLQTLIRAERYRVLLKGSGETNLPGRFQMFLVTAARNMFVDMFPARLGELSYIAMLNRGYRVSGQACVSSLSVAFLFDFVALLVVVGAACIMPILASDLRAVMLVTGAGLVLLVLVGGAVLFVGIRLVVRWTERRFPKLTARPLVGKLFAFADRLVEAFDNTRKAGVFWKTFVLSLGVRICKYSGLYFAFLAVCGPSFEALSRAPFWNVLIALLAAEASASLPIPTFMSFGAYEAGGLLALKILGFSAAGSAVAMLAMHIVSQLVDYTLGGLALVVFILTGSERSPAAAEKGKPARTLLLVAAGLLVIALAAGALFLQYHTQKKRGSLLPPAAGAAVTPSPAETAQRGELTEHLEGFLVWSSNRYGQHDILMRTFPDGATTRLTDDPHTETFPRISPDGRQVVFCRSQPLWVSQRNPLPWDVYVVDVATRQARLVARNGNTPTWSRDGRTVYFQRHGDSVVAHRLDTGEEEVLFRAGTEPLPEGIQLQTPDVSDADGTLAVTLRGSRAFRITALIGKDGTLTRVGGGSQCQLAWSRDESFLYLVGHGGRQKNMIYRYLPNAQATTPWLDLAGELSHEYFPRQSNDGRYLVLGASRGGREHEHDSADYELFLWPIGSPPASAVRLTFHTGNDCWPDLYLRDGRGE